MDSGCLWTPWQPIVLELLAELNLFCTQDMGFVWFCQARVASEQAGGRGGARLGLKRVLSDLQSGRGWARAQTSPVQAVASTSWGCTGCFLLFWQSLGCCRNGYTGIAASALNDHFIYKINGKME